MRPALDRNKISRKNSTHKQTEEALRRAYAQMEIFLAAIPSILIGVNPQGIVTHWNAAAEKTFGIPASRVINHPFYDCGVRWEVQKILSGMEECCVKRAAVRVDDIPFRRVNGQDGFLGMTILPMRQIPEGPVQCILFGADITQRKRMEELKNEFVSTVSHELRTPLTIIKEAVSQVQEGLLGTVSEGQKHSLSIALEGIERLGRIVDDLLDMSKIEAGRLELRRELVDFVSLARGMSIAFSYQIKERGLELKTRLPDRKIELYIDKDKIVQVFTNLISNALKFTEKGFIEIAVEDRSDSVECRVTDTGRGMAQEDLPKVFTKFQQFSRANGPGVKGTGLGLAISKGIVELHGGHMSLQSELEKGSSFIFVLPKYTVRELFKESIAKSLKEAFRGEAMLSMILLEMKNFSRIQEKLGREKTAALMLEIENLVKKNFHRRTESVRDSWALLILISDMKKEEALIVSGRIQQVLQDFWAGQKLPKAEFVCRVGTFPADGNTPEALLEKIWN